jgi:serine/threonine protein kinase
LSKGDPKEKKNDKPISRKDFKEIKIIGRGNVGTVYLVRLRGTKEFYAMKVLSKEEMIKKNKVWSRVFCFFI